MGMTESYRPLGMGMGVIIIMGVWALVLVLLWLLPKLPHSPFPKLGPLLLLAAVLFTVILACLPRKARVEPEKDITKYDYGMLKRMGVLIVMAISLLLGLRLLVVMHLRCPRTAQRLNRRYVDYYHRG